MAKSATDIVDLAVAELGDDLWTLKELVVVEGGGYLVREAKDVSVHLIKLGRVSEFGDIANDVDESTAAEIRLARLMDLL